MPHSKAISRALDTLYHDCTPPRRTTPMPSDYARPEDDPKWRRMLIAECVESGDLTLMEAEELPPLMILETKRTIRLGTFEDATPEELDAMLVVTPGPFTKEELPRYAAMLAEQLERQWDFDEGDSDEGPTIDIDGTEYPTLPWSML